MDEMFLTVLPCLSLYNERYKLKQACHCHSWVVFNTKQSVGWRKMVPMMKPSFQSLHIIVLCMILHLTTWWKNVALRNV